MNCVMRHDIKDQARARRSRARPRPRPRHRPARSPEAPPPHGVHTIGPSSENPFVPLDTTGPREHVRGVSAHHPRGLQLDAGAAGVECAEAPLPSAQGRQVRLLFSWKGKARGCACVSSRTRGLSLWKSSDAFPAAEPVEAIAATLAVLPPLLTVSCRAAFSAAAAPLNAASAS